MHILNILYIFVSNYNLKYYVTSSRSLQESRNYNARSSEKNGCYISSVVCVCFRKSNDWETARNSKCYRRICFRINRRAEGEHDHLPALRQGNQVKPRKVSICARVIRAFFVPFLKCIHFFCGYIRIKRYICH